MLLPCRIGVTRGRRRDKQGRAEVLTHRKRLQPVCCLEMGSSCLSLQSSGIIDPSPHLSPF